MVSDASGVMAAILIVHVLKLTEINFKFVICK